MYISMYTDLRVPHIDLLTPHAYLGLAELEVIKDSLSRSAGRNSAHSYCKIQIVNFVEFTNRHIDKLVSCRQIEGVRNVSATSN